jgi:hypothetical protein
MVTVGRTDEGAPQRAGAAFAREGEEVGLGLQPEPGRTTLAWTRTSFERVVPGM